MIAPDINADLYGAASKIAEDYYLWTGVDLHQKDLIDRIHRALIGAYSAGYDACQEYETELYRNGC